MHAREISRLFRLSPHGDLAGLLIRREQLPQRRSIQHPVRRSLQHSMQLIAQHDNILDPAVKPAPRIRRILIARIARQHDPPPTPVPQHALLQIRHASRHPRRPDILHLQPPRNRILRKPLHKPLHIRRRIHHPPPARLRQPLVAEDPAALAPRDEHDRVARRLRLIVLARPRLRRPRKAAPQTPVRRRERRLRVPVRRPRRVLCQRQRPHRRPRRAVHPVHAQHHRPRIAAAVAAGNPHPVGGGLDVHDALVQLVALFGGRRQSVVERLDELRAVERERAAPVAATRC
ncbi:predicted protein [Aspergillus terreus NIH2624]|uniref:Uncharacterized protein n=1 Tax=Aspergillus terreus (strain NIH 2624 / FGSC A1156) TaxID=341663 RepID=Q0CGE4_ASPTN|nr:uncharacterized protein ATEG_07248 [Aspergillus terreus NIH2624]EAU32632.1 predicted protein [Aspergillus terreus NIH2624]